jgi:putative acyl-CoA dehydrogenase
MEVLGGNGYVEDGPLARIYRQMPLNSIWEGSGNVMCLDVLRAIGRDSRCVDALAAELAPASGRHAAFDAFASRLKDDIAQTVLEEGGSRRLTQRIALAVQAALLLRFAPEPVAQAFCASRLAGAGFAGGAFGNLPGDVDFSAIIARAAPSR